LSVVKIHKCVKLLTATFLVTSNFEQTFNIIVIAKAGNTYFMETVIQLKNIEEDQKTDKSTVEQIAKIIHFLRNIED